MEMYLLIINSGYITTTQSIIIVFCSVGGQFCSTKNCTENAVQLMIGFYLHCIAVLQFGPKFPLENLLL